MGPAGPQKDGYVGMLLRSLFCFGRLSSGPQHVVRRTWYITDKQEYLRRARELGRVYQEVIGRHDPVMTLVQVTALLEDRAQVEIEATAVLPD